jgi:hypothetical protein
MEEMATRGEGEDAVVEGVTDEEGKREGVDGKGGRRKGAREIRRGREGEDKTAFFVEELETRVSRVTNDNGGVGLVEGNALRSVKGTVF